MAKSQRDSPTCDVGLPCIGNGIPATAVDMTLNRGQVPRLQYFVFWNPRSRRMRSAPPLALQSPRTPPCPGVCDGRNVRTAGRPSDPLLRRRPLQTTRPATKLFPNGCDGAGNSIHRFGIRFTDSESSRPPRRRKSEIQPASKFSPALENSPCPRNAHDRRDDGCRANFSI